MRTSVVRSAETAAFGLGDALSELSVMDRPSFDLFYHFAA
jgi:hypothetical protein